MKAGYSQRLKVSEAFGTGVSCPSPANFFSVFLTMCPASATLDRFF